MVKLGVSVLPLAALALGLAAMPTAVRAQQPTKPLVNPKLPKDAQISQLIAKAERFQQTKKPAEAAQHLQAAADLSPDDWALWDRAGWAHIDAGKADSALKAFSTAAKIAPAGTPMFGGPLIANYRLGNGKEVAGLIERHTAADLRARVLQVAAAGLAAKGRPEWHFGLGYLYARTLNNSRRGIQPLEAAVRDQPKNAEAWLLLYELNNALDEGAFADEAALKYLALQPESVDAFRIRGERYVAQQEIGDASEEYEAGIAKHPLAADLYYQLARVQERYGSPLLADQTYGRLIKAADAAKNQTLALQARGQLASFHTRRQNFVAAEKFYREIAARPETTVATLNAWASLLALTSKWDEAAKVYERTATPKAGMAVDADEALQAQYRAGVCWLAFGDRAAAKKAFEAAITQKGSSRTSPEMEAQAFLTYLTGRTAPIGQLAYQKSDERVAAFVWRKEPEDETELEVRGRFSPAARAWRASLQAVQKKMSDCWPADYALSRIWAATGFTDPAVQLLRNVARGRADWWAPRFALGQLYTGRREKDQAIEELRVVLKLAPECRQAKVYLTLLNSLRDEDDPEPEPK